MDSSKEPKKLNTKQNFTLIAIFLIFLSAFTFIGGGQAPMKRLLSGMNKKKR